MNHDSPRFADPDYQPDRFYEPPAYDDHPDYYYEERRAEERSIQKEVNEISSLIPSNQGR